MLRGMRAVLSVSSRAGVSIMPLTVSEIELLRWPSEYTINPRELARLSRTSLRGVLENRRGEALAACVDDVGFDVMVVAARSNGGASLATIGEERVAERRVIEAILEGVMESLMSGVFDRLYHVIATRHSLFGLRLGASKATLPLFDCWARPSEEKLRCGD